MIDSAEHDERVMTLATEALKLPVAERDSFLQSACQNDPELYREVSEVVTWEERMKGFLRRPLIEFIDLDALEKVFEAGQTVSGRFEILRCVGEGGMGVVYEAFDRKRGLRVAIKVAKPGFGRLLSPELEGALKVRHRNICVVNDIYTATTEYGELDFLTMEFLDGETLAHRLARGRPEEAEALEIARQLCAGVGEAHRSGILHRDLKPANIILCREKDGSLRVVITDFGLSTEGADTELGGGTPAYMAPELWRGVKASPASDSFALGVILYEIVAGQKPFSSSTKNQGFQEIPPPLPPSKLAPGLRQRWDAAILPCFRPAPEDRYTARQVLAELERKPYYRRPTLIAMAAMGIVLASLATWGILGAYRPPAMRLAIVPMPVPNVGLAKRGQEIMEDVAARVKQIQDGKATVSVIQPSQILRKGVTTPEQAAKVLGATHVLQLQLTPTVNGIAVKGVLVDLHTRASIQDYSSQFAESDLGDLSTGLTGLISWALRLHRKAPPTDVPPAAAESYRQGQAYLKQEPPDFIHAIPEFENAASLAPHSPLPLAGLAEAHGREYRVKRNQDSINEAHFWLSRAEALDADSPAVRNASGFLHILQGDYAHALSDYQRVEEIDPTNMEAFLGSGLAYEFQAILDKAIADYNRALSVAPSSYKPYEFLASLYYNNGEYEKAEEMYRATIQRDPSHMDAYGSLAAVYSAQGKYEDAEKILRTTLRYKETALNTNDLGVILAFEGRQPEAAEYYRRAVTAEPTKAKYWLNLGDAQRRIEDLKNSKASYQRGLALAEAETTANVNNAPARARLAYLQARLNHGNEAAAQIAAALNSPAKNDEVVLCAVETYEVLGDRNKAIDAAKLARPEILHSLDHHPDLADLQQDSRFRQLMAQVK
ncbi:MAG TPA: protein kinase [Candidatus Angelobacter sp.]|nr:protein kinase [Candidatus Angelobacter sp.]